MINRLALAVAISALVLAACGGDDGGDDESATARATSDATAAPTADAFDPAILSAFVLAPDEIPPDLGCNGTFNPPGNAGIAFALTCEGNDFSILSQAVRIVDTSMRDALFTRTRESFALVGPEENYELPGADQAFLYTGNQPPIAILAILAFKGDFVLNISTRSQEGTQAARASDRAALDQYARLMLGRLQQYLDDPSSVTPVPGVVFGTPTADAAGGATPAATP